MNMIPNNLWIEIAKLLPTKKTKVGRPEIDARKAISGIFFVLKTGIQWYNLPKEFGAPTTIHCKFRKWIKLGVFKNIMKKAAEVYNSSNENDNIWYATDTSSCKAPLGYNWVGKNPTDRGKKGAKKSIIVDRKGAPLAVQVGPANKHDSKFFENTLNNLKHNQKTLKIMTADSAYDTKQIKKICLNFILLASTNTRRNKNKEKFKPLHRWIVERTIAWLSWYRGIFICWSRTISSFEALLELAASNQLFKMSGIFV